MCKIEIERERATEKRDRVREEHKLLFYELHMLCLPFCVLEKKYDAKKSFNVKRDKNCKALILSQTKMLHLQAYILYVQEVVTRFI